MIFDSWGNSWGATSAWGQSWVHTRAPVVIDTHDGVDERLNEYVRRKEELHESILRAFEDVTGESKEQTVESIEKQVEVKQGYAFKRIRQDVFEYKEIDQEILRISKSLQEREVDIAFILSVL